MTTLLFCWFFQPIRMFLCPKRLTVFFRMHVSHSNPFELNNIELHLKKVSNGSSEGMTNVAYDSPNIFFIISALDGFSIIIQTDTWVLKRNSNQFENVIYHVKINRYIFFLSYFLRLRKNSHSLFCYGFRCYSYIYQKTKCLR